MFAKKKSNDIEILSEEEINNLLQESDMISTGEKDDDLLAEIFGVGAEKPPLPSPEEMKNGLSIGREKEEEIRKENKWLKRLHMLPSFKFESKRDGSTQYKASLKEAVIAVTTGNFGSLEYKGYKLYYDDTPRVKSWSLDGKRIEYSYEVKFVCEALRLEQCEFYHSEEERRAYYDPENEEYFSKTMALLDARFELLDKGSWLKDK